MRVCVKESAEFGQRIIVAIIIRDDGVFGGVVRGKHKAVAHKGRNHGLVFGGRFGVDFVVGWCDQDFHRTRLCST